MTDPLPIHVIFERLKSIALAIAEIEKGSLASFTGATPLTEEQITKALQQAIEEFQ